VIATDARRSILADVPLRSAPVPAWLRLCIAAAILIGIGFRLYHVDRKVYWDDEIFTTLHVNGLTEADVVRRAPQVLTVGALRAVIHPTPRLHSIAATVRSLMVEDPHHTPLYYVLAVGWARLFGDSVTALRMLSVTLGIVALPCMFWLCSELLASRLAAWIGTALLALAPVSVLYSQEAREYALWTVAVILLGATFIAATRRESAAAWALYAAALTFALYVFPFSAFLALANLTLLAARSVFPDRGSRLALVAATAAAFALFAPWIAVFVHSIGQIDRSMHTTIAHHHSPAFVLRAFLNLFRLDFIDLNVLHHAAVNLLLLVPGLALTAIALAAVALSRDERVRFFIIAQIVFSAAPFVLPDLIISGDRTTNPRYFTPMYLGLDLALAYAFAAGLTQRGGDPGRLRAWTAIFALVVIARVVSCGVSSQAQTWWTKYNERSIAVARTINATPHSLIISDNFIEYMLSLTTYLDDGVALDLQPRCYQCSLPAPRSFDVVALKRVDPQTDVYALGPSARMQSDVLAALQRSGRRPQYHCIDVRSNCMSELHLW
jgi:uncharacterized membrane protein